VRTEKGRKNEGSASWFICLMIGKEMEVLLFCFVFFL